MSLSTARRSSQPGTLVAATNEKIDEAERYAARVALAGQAGWEVVDAFKPTPAARKVHSELAQAGLRLLGGPSRRPRGQPTLFCPVERHDRHVVATGKSPSGSPSVRSRSRVPSLVAAYSGSNELSNVGLVRT
ncbi:MAG: hypothetical protein WAU75_24555 [Solirubrobacteraceae bacterium]